MHDRPGRNMFRPAARHMCRAGQSDKYYALNLVGGPLHHRLHLVRRLAEAAQHVGGDLVGVGSRWASNADAHAHEVG